MFSTAKTIKMLTPFCILSDAVSPLLCQRSEIWKLYLGMHITFSLNFVKINGDSKTDLRNPGVRAWAPFAQFVLVITSFEVM